LEIKQRRRVMEFFLWLYLIVYLGIGSLVAYGFSKALDEISLIASIYDLIGWPFLLVPKDIRYCMYIGWSGDVDKAWEEHYQAELKEV
jgi:hypothetical protein